MTHAHGFLAPDFGATRLTTRTATHFVLSVGVGSCAWSVSRHGREIPINRDYLGTCARPAAATCNRPVTLAIAYQRLGRAAEAAEAYRHAEQTPGGRLQIPSTQPPGD